ncbi:carboxypeptidase B-like [Lytechinus variegatus]|uniref:carboxypeptidase B-like n=1 Tax=Lytechinus variegatus TaxID=7654 RepID=UPI001BB1A41B|nr:carboxypeptidase B-like [Lytechinus variegatus]
MRSFLTTIRRCFLLFISLLGIATAAVRYDNYKVVRISPETEEDLLWVKTLADVWENRVDIWKHPRLVDSPVDVMVAPHWQTEFFDVLNDQGIGYTEMIGDVQELVKAEAEAVSRRKRSTKIKLENDEFDYSVYHRLEDIYKWITDTANEHYTIATQEQLSTSHEGRPVTAIKIGSPGNQDNKPIAYIQGGIHAREWISPATMMGLAKKLIDGYTTSDKVKAMLDKFDWYIVPVLNPDGYLYTWTNDRMWRKNRRKPDGNVCTGIDLNRNYGYEWGGRGSSAASCSETYRGPGPLSEPEHQGVSSFLLEKQRTNGVHLFLDVHSYGQYWLYPWGYTASKADPLPDRRDLRSLALAAEDAITAKHGLDYFVGQSGPDFYPAAGASEDWGYGELGAKYTYVIELRDEGKYGFLLPEREIQFTVEEMFEALLVVGDRLISEFAS